MKLSIELADGKRLSYDSCGDLLVIDAPRVEVTTDFQVELPAVSIDALNSPVKSPGVSDTASIAAYIRLLTHAAMLRERIINGADPETRKLVESALQYVKSQEQVYMMPKPAP